MVSTSMDDALVYVALRHAMGMDTDVRNRVNEIYRNYRAMYQRLLLTEMGINEPDAVSNLLQAQVQDFLESNGGAVGVDPDAETNWGAEDDSMEADDEGSTQAQGAESSPTAVAPCRIPNVAYVRRRTPAATRQYFHYYDENESSSEEDTDITDTQRQAVIDLTGED